MVKSSLLILLIFIGHFVPAAAQTITEKALSVGNILQIEFPSQVLNQARMLSVYLPENYHHAKKAYPTLYLLDGERHLPHAVLATRLYQDLGAVPELIIVAIHNHTEEDARENDFYHHREKFSKFIGQELQPYMNNTYRTTGSSTLYGHSLAAYFALNLLATEPDLFANYILAGPPLQGQVKDMYHNLANRKFAENKKLYITMAPEAAEGEQVYRAYDQFVQHLSAQTLANLKWKAEEMAVQSHISNYYISFFKGIFWVFN
nr:alpha/beta hydrolase-fold protein [Bowmanella yangjiangensis]